MKKIIKAIPYSSYDIDSISLWLEENAEKGLFIVKDGMRLGFAKFEKGEPRRVKYRFVPPYESSQYQDNFETAKEIMSDFGWEYVCTLNSFHLYVNDNCDAEEPITDSSTAKSMLIKEKRNIAGNTVGFLTPVLSWTIQIIFNFSDLFLTIIMMPLWYSLIVILSLIFGAAIIAVQWIIYFNAKKRFERNLPSKKSRKNYSSLATVIIIVINIALFFLMWVGIGFKDSIDIKKSVYNENVPFVTVNDIFGKDLYPDNIGMFDSNFFVPTRIQLIQKAQHDGNDVSYYAWYYDTRFEWIVAKIGKIYLEKNMPDESIRLDRYCDESTTCYSYTDSDSYEIVLIVYKNKMICARISITSDSDTESVPDDFIKIVLDGLKSN